MASAIEDKLGWPGTDAAEIPQSELIVDRDWPDYSLLLQRSKDVVAIPFECRLRTMNSQNDQVVARLLAIERPKIRFDILAIDATECVEIHDDDLSSNEGSGRRGVKPVVRREDGVDGECAGLSRQT